MSRRRLLDRNIGVLYNTLIGGLASTYPTKASLATKLAISETDISYFNINGSDIEAKIEVAYNLAVSAFNATGITKYIETEARVLSIGTDAFSDTRSLTRAEFINPASFGVYIFRSLFGQTYAARDIIFKETTALTVDSLGQLNATNLWIPKVTSLGATAGNDNVFNTRRSAFTVYANVALETNNAGGMDGDLSYLQGLGSTINFVTQYNP